MNFREEMIATNPLLQAGKDSEAILRLEALLESAFNAREWNWCKTIGLHLSAILDHAGMKGQAKATPQKVVDATVGDPDPMLLLALSHYESPDARLALLRRSRQIAAETKAPDYLLEALDVYLSEG